jgi:Rieske Fe-S protein
MNPRPNTSLRSGVSRRTVLGVSVAGATGLLAACGGSSDTTAPESDTDDTSDETSSSAEESESGSADEGGLVETEKVPVGEGIVLKDQKIVVTQPTKGTFKAFTAVCTHQGCTVDKVQDGTIMCPCHGSTYSAKDGSVTGGPAPKALAEIAVKVDGDEVVKA